MAILGPLHHPEWKELETVSQAFGMRLQALIFERPEQLETLFQAARKKRAEGLVVLASGHINPYYSLQIVEFATQNRFPAIYPTRNYVTHGGLMAYGMNMAAIFRRGAYYVDRILKGAEPSELPVNNLRKLSSLSISGRLSRSVSRFRPRYSIGRIRLLSEELNDRIRQE